MRMKVFDMTEPAAKMDDKISSDGTSMVWVQPPGSPPPNPISVAFSYEGPIDNGLSSNVFIMGKRAATVGSTATNSKPPNTQPAVSSKGTLITAPIDNTATITTGSPKVFINGKKAARHGDSAKTSDYSTPPSPGISQKIENAKVNATGSVLIGG